MENKSKANNKREVAQILYMCYGFNYPDAREIVEKNEDLFTHIGSESTINIVSNIIFREAV